VTVGIGVLGATVGRKVGPADGCLGTIQSTSEGGGVGIIEGRRVTKAVGRGVWSDGAVVLGFAVGMDVGVRVGAGVDGADTMDFIVGIVVDDSAVDNTENMSLLALKRGTGVRRRLREPGIRHATSVGGAVGTRVGILLKTKLGTGVGAMDGCMVGILVGFALGTEH
jgi:hypothetical protein